MKEGFKKNSNIAMIGSKIGSNFWDHFFDFLRKDLGPQNAIFDHDLSLPANPLDLVEPMPCADDYKLCINFDISST